LLGFSRPADVIHPVYEDAVGSTNDASELQTEGEAPPTSLSLLPASVVQRLSVTSLPATPFKPKPSLIVPPAPSHTWPARPVETILEAQIALARQGFSAGSIDGLNGPKTRRALRAFQEQQGSPATGALDPATKARLLMTEPPLTRHVVTTQDLQRLAPVPATWAGKSQVPRLEYESLIELVSERSHSSPDLIRQLNQDLDWRRVGVGAALTVPKVRQPVVRAKAAGVRIHLDGRVLEVFDAATNRVALFPCSIAREVQHRLVGRLQVASIALDPEYLFVPSRFRQTVEVRQIKQNLSIPPGPNNPVGSVWIGLDRPGYGIHGTPHPERVGQAESLGCFRLANWDAELLARLVWVGMPVDIVP
jgi:lipoprotein-anchoring transpeptidase ErfK/SrfK